MRSKNYSGKNASRFICLKCMKSDGVPSGIQRIHNMKEKGHIKNLYCVHCRTETKCLEVRYRDYLPDMMEYAKQIRTIYYKEGWLVS